MTTITANSREMSRTKREHIDLPKRAQRTARALGPGSLTLYLIGNGGCGAAAQNEIRDWVAEYGHRRARLVAYGEKSVDLGLVVRCENVGHKDLVLGVGLGKPRNDGVCLRQDF